MKKLIIVIALVLTSVVTAFSLTNSQPKTETGKIDSQNAAFHIKSSSSPKSDIATAD